MRSTSKGTPGGNASSRVHGSSLRELGAPLDQERAASMADEGGVAGAFTDSVAQTCGHAAALTTRAARSDFRSILPWALLVTGVVGGVAAAVWAWRRSDYWG